MNGVNVVPRIYRARRRVPHVKSINCHFLSNTFVLDLILRHPHYGVVAIEQKTQKNTQSDALMTL